MPTALPIPAIVKKKALLNYFFQNSFELSVKVSTFDMLLLNNGQITTLLTSKIVQRYGI